MAKVEWRRPTGNYQDPAGVDLSWRTMSISDNGESGIACRLPPGPGRLDGRADPLCVVHRVWLLLIVLLKARETA
jgi:hypothetical protein